MAECTFFEKSDRSGRVESEKGNFVLQELSCKESIYVLSEGVSGNRISGMPLLCGWNYKRKLETDAAWNWWSAGRDKTNYQPISVDDVKNKNAIIKF